MRRTLIAIRRAFIALPSTFFNRKAGLALGITLGCLCRFSGSLYAQQPRSAQNTPAVQQTRAARQPHGARQPHALRDTHGARMILNKREYLENQGVNVMLAHDFYPEGHQGGVGIIQQGQRVATNGDIRLEPTPGQWSPIPKVGKRMINLESQEISVRMEYPDSAINRKGFNPILYPDLHFAYTLRIRPAGEGFRILVDLDKPVPDEWIGKVGFNFELFPGTLFGKSYYMDEQSGIFPQQAYDPMTKDRDGEWQVAPMATGKRLIIAPESDKQRMIIENVNGDPLQLLDGRGKHTNGWFVVRSLVAKGASKNAIEWLVSPHAIKGWKADPVVQVSQVGYHPRQSKIAVIELDAKDENRPLARLLRISENGGTRQVLSAAPKEWGDFLRYHYLQFDFTSVKEPGMYLVEYGLCRTQPFAISADVFNQHVWQPTLEYFLPVQMCHMRINDKYRVWHGFCHLDDARMAPVDSNHFDGYIQGPSTLTRFQPGESVPLLNRGGWHDAGDFDLRIESQAETVLGLTLAYEQFDVPYDNTTIDQAHQVVEIQRPDGKPDMLQQIEHGLLSIVGGYQAMGRFYRGIIEPTIRQYTLLGDPANLTDNKPFKAPAAGGLAVPVGLPGSPDDRWVFTENNPGRSLETAASLAAAYRVMKGFNDSLAESCLRIAKEVWRDSKEKNPLQRVPLAVELLVTTHDKSFGDFLVANTGVICRDINRTGWVVGRTFSLIDDREYKKEITEAVKAMCAVIRQEGGKTPYGVPYKPNIWGAGWDIQHFGYKQYFLHTYFPGIVGDEYMLDAINFVLGCHPGSNTASFVSGVGANSMTTAYGFNRADWSYIPGGVTSGTALIRPDFPELMKWPFFWQQGEYVLGGGTTDYLFLILAADHILSGRDARDSRDTVTIKKDDRAERLSLAADMEASLKKELLDKWYPQSSDSVYGGFLSTFTFDHKPTGSQDKMIVTQARHTWVNAKASIRYPSLGYFKTGARQGFLFLANHFWDKAYGGFYTFVDRAGNPKKANFAEKEAFGNGYAIYALAAYYRSSGDTGALHLAQRAFSWLEAHSHDPVYNGYYKQMERDGTPLKRTAATSSLDETGYKDQNTVVHLMEAFTELYGVWRDSLVRERLQELLVLLRDRIIPAGDSAPALFFQPDWEPVSFRDSSRESILKHHNLDHVSFGYEVETAYLMLEASRALGMENDPGILRVGKKMVDHALQYGWDGVLGGFYDEGYAFAGEPTITITRDSKNWWAQAEGLNALLIMADQFPDDPRQYFKKFLLLWKYTRTYLIDPIYGDWYSEGLDKEPLQAKALKGNIWKATYHNYRALDNCITRLRS
jgi:endoglucanase